MTQRSKILVVLGTRPEAIKMAPVIRELQARATRFDLSVCLTGQHRQLLDQVIAVFDIPVAHDLDIMSPEQSLFDVTTQVLRGMESVLDKERPDAVLVHGDTTTTLAATLAAYYRRIPIGHVEAGLRTYDKLQPFPEEMNRRITDAICDYHYAPTEQARENLLAERINPRGIVVTGNTAIDAVLDISSRPYAFTEPVLRDAGTAGRLLLVTAHRRENFGKPMQDICRALIEIAHRITDLEIVYPAHPNPEVRKPVDALLRHQARIHVIEPLDYVPFVHLMKKANLVLTDSGGLQEEAPALGKPVLVMREKTERPEAVETGAARLVGCSTQRIVDSVIELLTDESAYARMVSVKNPFGDGRAAIRIVDHLANAITRPSA